MFCSDTTWPLGCRLNLLLSNEIYQTAKPIYGMIMYQDGPGRTFHKGLYEKTPAQYDDVGRRMASNLTTKTTMVFNYLGTGANILAVGSASKDYFMDGDIGTGMYIRELVTNGAGTSKNPYGIAWSVDWELGRFISYTPYYRKTMRPHIRSMIGVVDLVQFREKNRCGGPCPGSELLEMLNRNREY